MAFVCYCFGQCLLAVCFWFITYTLAMAGSQIITFLAYQSLPLSPSLMAWPFIPPHPSSGCTRLSHTVTNIKWTEPSESHPQRELFILIPAKQISVCLSLSLSLSLPLFFSLHCLKILHKNRGFHVPTPQAFLSVHWAKTWGIPFKKTRFSSGHGVQMWKSRQLQPCCEQLSLFTQSAPRLSEGGCPTNCFFQWLEQTKVRKISTSEIFASTLDDWFVCSNFLTEVCFRQQPA